MFELFKMDENYTLPNGQVFTGEELVTSGEYPMLNEQHSAVDVIGGILRAITTVEDLKMTYGIGSNESTDILAEANTIRFAQNMEKSTRVKTMDVVAKAARISALSFTDEQALEVPDLYPEYEVKHEYKQNERFTYNGRLFKVNQDHTSAEQWVPGETGTESLYTCLEMAGDGYLVWTRPTGAHNAYNTGDIVYFPTDADPLYKSLIDGNTWSPTEYPQGWELYTEE